jgi:hypothetical protein
MNKIGWTFVVLMGMLAMAGLTFVILDLLPDFV